MNKMQEKIHNAIRSMACNMAAKEPREWPPQCLIIAYQPMRPETKPEEKVTSPEK